MKHRKSSQHSDPMTKDIKDSTALLIGQARCSAELRLGAIVSKNQTSIHFLTPRPDREDRQAFDYTAARQGTVQSSAEARSEERENQKDPLRDLSTDDEDHPKFDKTAVKQGTVQ